MKNLAIIKQLSDGHFHSGESLGKLLGVSRTAVWKYMQAVQQEYGLSVQSVRGRGYRLAAPVELLDEKKILQAIRQYGGHDLAQLDILTRVDSTNRYLLAAASQGGRSGQVVLAEQQTAGRGRQGRPWVSPFGANLYCSLLWEFKQASSELSGLGIVVALAVIKTLSSYAGGLKIKWPNDIFWQGRKLAGILLEVQGEANGPAQVVMGVGINVGMPRQYGRQIDQAWTDLNSAAGQAISRNELAARLIAELLVAIKRFNEHGLAVFLPEWSEWDMLENQSVDLVFGSNILSGIARGIADSGALRIEMQGEIKTFMAGEVSIRGYS